MSTATPAIVTKTEQASQLRAESVALGKEVSELRKKLEIAQRALGVLQDKRQKFTEEAAAGRQPKPGAIATLAAEITEAQIPVDGLTRAVNEKQARLDTVRANLESLEYELRLDAQRTARQERFDALGKQLGGPATVIAEKLRQLMTEDLPAFAAARDALTNEFVGRFSGDTANPEANRARRLIHEFEAQFLDVEYKLRKQGWTAGNVELTVRSLRPPQ